MTKTVNTSGALAVSSILICPVGQAKAEGGVPTGRMQSSETPQVVTTTIGEVSQPSGLDNRKMMGIIATASRGVIAHDRHHEAAEHGDDQQNQRREAGDQGCQRNGHEDVDARGVDRLFPRDSVPVQDQRLPVQKCEVVHPQKVERGQEDDRDQSRHV